MKPELKVSVIVPVYNVEEYLCDCLNSLVNQTIDKSQMEVLLIDDGSKDSSLEICQRYEEKYPFWYLFYRLFLKFRILYLKYVLKRHDLSKVYINYLVLSSIIYFGFF